MLEIDGWDEMSQEKKDLPLDLEPLTLDIVEIVEPTPFADSTSAIIRLLEGIGADP